AQLNEPRLRSVASLADGLSFRAVAPEHPDRDSFKVVTKAVSERRELTFQYRKWAEKAGCMRRVQPYHLTCVDYRSSLLGYDCVRRSVRTFALSRFSEPRLCRRRFPRPKHFDPASYLEGSLGIMKGKSDYEVVIELDAAGADLVRGCCWHVPSEFQE